MSLYAFQTYQVQRSRITGFPQKSLAERQSRGWNRKRIQENRFGSSLFDFSDTLLRSVNFIYDIHSGENNTLS